MNKHYNFKTNLGCVRIDDRSCENEDGCLKIDVDYSVEDAAGNLYERKLTISSVTSLHPMFSIDPSIFTDLIRTKPATKFDNKSIICGYLFDVLGRKQIINVVIPVVDVVDGNVSEITKMRNAIKQLQRQMANREKERDQIKMVLELLILTNPDYLRKRVLFDQIGLWSSGFWINSRNDSGIPHLHIAMRNPKDIEKYEDLSTYDLDVINAKDGGGQTAIMNRGNPFLVRKLIKFGADVNAIDMNGYNALHLWCVTKPINYEVITDLLKAGADPNTHYRGVSLVKLLTGKSGTPGIMKNFQMD